MHDTGLATAADYSEALSVARRAKSLLALLLMLVLVLQLATFFLVKYDVLKIEIPGAIHSIESATQPVSEDRLTDLLHYLTGATLLGGIAAGIVLSLVLLLITHVMLVGRLIGVGKVMSAIIWSFVLVVLLFPWQTFMDATTFKLTGVLWTWSELLARVKTPDDFTGDALYTTIVHWFRFVVAPLAAIVVTLIVQLKSNRGLKMALGEDEVLNEMLGK